jgi:hypothetical protein
MTPLYLRENVNTIQNAKLPDLIIFENPECLCH